MGLKDLFKNHAEKKIWKRLGDDHVIDSSSGQGIDKNDAYFVIRMTEMYLENTRKVWQKFYPMLHSFTEYLGQERHEVAGPGQLKELDDSSLDRIMNFNYRLTDTTAYLGGDVDILVGLYSVPQGDAAKTLLDTVSSVAGLANAALGPAMEITRVVKTGIEGILAFDKSRLQLGVRDSFFTNNPLRSGYHVAIDASEADVDFDMLWLKGSRLMKGASPDDLATYEDHDYMVLEIERIPSRDDWSSLHELSKFEGQFSGLITNPTMDRDQKIMALKRMWPEFQEALRASRSLIHRDKERIATDVAADLKKRLPKEPGLDFESAATFAYAEVTNSFNPRDARSLDMAVRALEGDPFTE